VHLRDRKAPIHADRRAGPVAGVVLAAGTSSRMGRNKLLLDLEGEPLLRRTVRRAAAAGLDPVIVVLGHEADRAAAVLEELPCRPLLNPSYEQGIGTSLQAGISAVPSECAAALVLLADMPFVTAEMIATVVERYRSGAAPLVTSDYGGVNAPPTLYDRSLFAEIEAMRAERCGKQVVQRHRGEAIGVSWPPEALRDVDVVQDYQRIRGEPAAGEGDAA
jgi:molybdenum cofactor cytidylyltransferase